MKTTRLLGALTFAALAPFFTFLDQSRAATISWTNTAGGNWSVAANWSAGALPAAADTVLITAAGSYTVTQDVNVTVTRLTLGGASGRQTLTNAGYTLTLNGASAINANGVLGFGNGTLTGAGLLTVNGWCLWSAGNWSGSILVAAGGAVDLVGNTDKGLFGSVTNQGTITWKGTSHLLMADGRIHNQPGGLFEIQNNQSVAFYSGAPAIHNSGTIRKSSGGGDSTIAVPLINSGALEVLSGRVGYVGGSQFNSGTAFTGAGTNSVYTGVVTFNGALTSENLEITSDGTLNLAGTHTLSGTARWIGGTISGAMTIAANGTLNITGTADRGLSGSLNNQGRIVWSGANTILMAGGHLTNLTSAVFEIQNNQVLAFYSGVPKVHNSGTIRKSSGGGDSTIAVPLVNSGTLEVLSGRVGYVGGSQFNSGTAFTGAGTNSVYTGVVTFNGALASENLEIASDGTLTLAGTHTLSGAARWIGGTISGAMTIAANGTLNITGTAEHALTGSLNNLGLVTWAGANTIYVYNAPITNAAGALFEIQNNQTLSVYNGSPKFNNRGRIRKTTGGGITIIGLPLINSGTLDVQSGLIAYGSGSQFNSGTTFTGAGTNLVYTGTVTFNGAIPSENLEIGGATFGGNSLFSGRINWTSGALADDSAFTVATDGVLNITGSVLKIVTGSLTNLGLVTWSGLSDIEMHLTARIVNNFGALLDIQNNQSLYIYNGTPRLMNGGTIRKSSGGATSVISVPLINSGALDVRLGLIAYGAGSQFNLGTAFTGMGTNLVYTGNATFTGTILSENLEIDGASVLGTNTLMGTVKWISGEIGEPAHVTIATNGTLNIIGTSDRSIRDMLSNAGQVNWSGPGTILFVHTGTISNLTSGTFEIQNDGMLAHYSGVSSFKNAGVLRKSAGAGATTINLSTFNNTGTVDAQTGIIRFLSSYTQTAGRLRFGLGSLTNFGQVQFAQPAPLVGTLAANLLGGFRPKAGDAFAVISYYPAYTGAFTGFDLPNEAVWQTNSSIYGANAVTLTALNARPTIEPVPNKSVDEQSMLQFTISASDPDPGQSLTYALINPPQNAGINPNTGLFSWTPGEAQGPSTNSITIQVTDNGTPGTSATNMFVAVVREVNLAPSLGAIADHLLVLGDTLTVTNTASDPDIPINRLTYGLVEAPHGMTIVPSTGRLTWTPQPNQAPSTNVVVVQVTDNGSPQDNDQKSFTVAVFPLPYLTIASGGSNLAILSWPTLASQAGFALVSTTNLSPTIHWTPVTNSPQTIGATSIVSQPIIEPIQAFQLRRP